MFFISNQEPIKIPVSVFIFFSCSFLKSEMLESGSYRFQRTMSEDEETRLIQDEEVQTGMQA
jgi:hypothetical protein